ncbi:GNAT family N-acetyltransferase [Anaerosporobacter sp.]|uniref:GNAT family N-acetyltransferase n=1 Tax=Anaerosporobacter sp. TaxID=1872529 RepID=UPI00286F28CA|nr:GNAT family N-acetyltransferase [Anaerosporobacter sp.]
MYTYKKNTLTAEEWLHLREHTTWTLHSLADFKSALQGSLLTVSAYHGKKLIGMGRLIGDGFLCFYLQDIIILPEYRMQGIGSKIVSTILEDIQKNATTSITVGLMSAKGAESFYEKLGFEKRLGIPKGYGMEIIIQPN